MKKLLFGIILINGLVQADTYEKVTDQSVKITREVTQTVNVSVLQNQLKQIQSRRDQIQKAYDDQMGLLDKLQAQTQADIDGASKIGVNATPVENVAPLSK